MTENLIMDISRIMKKVMITDIFWGLFLSTIEKVETKDVPLAAVGLSKSDMSFKLYINAEEWFKCSDEVKFGIILHEGKHLAFFHLITMDDYSNHKMDNIACDIEINQTIDKRYLPTWGCFLEDFAVKHPKLDWKASAGRHHYYKELGKLSDKEKEELGIDEKAEHHWTVIDGDGNIVDPSTLTDSQKDAVRVQVEHTIEGIAEEISKSQGHIPLEISQLIKGFKKPKAKFNYKKYIRNFVGNSTKYFIKTTKLRENQRFPGAPKIVLRPTNKILVLIDESGSVSEPELYDFLNEIAHLSKTTDLEIRAFDTSVTDIVKYKSNSNSFPRSRCGGTSFTAAVDFYNNQKKYETCLIFTDGHAETPPKCTKNLLWVISSNGNEEAIKNHAKWLKIPIN
jgi:predicted metal-dependent peptidase